MISGRKSLQSSLTCQPEPQCCHFADQKTQWWSPARRCRGRPGPPRLLRWAVVSAPPPLQTTFISEVTIKNISLDLSKKNPLPPKLKTHWIRPPPPPWCGCPLKSVSVSSVLLLLPGLLQTASHQAGQTAVPEQPGGLRGGGEQQEMYRLQVPEVSRHRHGPGTSAGQGCTISRADIQTSYTEGVEKETTKKRCQWRGRRWWDSVWRRWDFWATRAGGNWLSCESSAHFQPCST